MAELTPIPAEHRKVYYDALLAGGAEAERLGYVPIDDRIFAAFYRTLYRPMVALIVADTRRQVAEEIEALRVPIPEDDESWDTWLSSGGWNAAIGKTASTARGSGGDETARQG